MDIGDSFQRFTDSMFEWLPRLIGAIVILIVAWIVARLVRDLLKRLLAKTGMDEAIHAGKSGDVVTRYASALTPSSLIADIVYWFIFLTGLVLAVSALGIDALTEAIGRITAYLPHVIAAILILVVGLAIAGVVGGAITSVLGDTPLGRVGAAVLPVLVVTVALFMALTELQIAEPIVVGAFYIVLGSICAAAALAFGLGGRNAAQKLLDGAYEKGQEAMPQVKADIETARARAAHSPGPGTSPTAY
ncbi:MAG: mechanosensitive ion channel [Thermoleophilia bacterium]